MLYVCRKSGAILHGLQLTNEQQHLPGALAIRFQHVEELSARVRPSGDFLKITGRIDAVVSAIGIACK